MPGTTASIVDWIRHHAASYCLDNKVDADRLSRVLAQKFATSRVGALASRLYRELYGQPFCTDDARDRHRVGVIVKRVLESSGVSEGRIRRRTRRRRTR